MAYGESQASNFALALAFACFMSMFPMILGALSLLGLAVRDPATQDHVRTLIIQSFPASAHGELVGALNGVKSSAGLLGIVSLGGLLWSASSIFSTMEFALTEIFGTKQRDMIRQRLMGLVMIVVLVVAIGAMAFVNSLAAFVPFAWVVSLLAGAVVMIALLVVLYRFVPNRTFKLREVLPGAVLAGILIEILALVFSQYARFAGHFNTYGATFGLFFVLATWFYFLSQIVLLGAVFNKFRLGAPDAEGIVASPAHESRDKKSAARSIEEKRRPADRRAAAARTPERAAPDHAPERRPRRSMFQRAALAAMVGLAVAAGVVRRRRPGAAG
jgi:membrane protein